MVEFGGDQRLNGLDRSECIDIDRLFDRHELEITGLEGGKIKPLLAAEIVVSHASIGASLLGNVFDTRSVETFGGKLLERCVQNALARDRCVAALHRYRRVL